MNKTTVHAGFFRKMFLVLLLSVALVSCSGGGIGGTGISGSTSSLSGTTGTSVGTITAFGSVFVNGVEFDTSETTITLNGNAGTETDLGLGMVVTVKGTFHDNGLTGLASSITYERSVKGKIEEIDLLANTLGVLGQSVVVNDETVFKDILRAPLEFSDFKNEDLVELSGIRNAEGTILATRLVRNPKAETATASVSTDFPTDQAGLRGRIQDVDETAMTFGIGKLAIGYQAAELVGLPDSGLTDGLFVLVVGSFDKENKLLVAARIRAKELVREIKEGERVEIEGLVTDFTSPENFKVNGLPISVDTLTQFENGQASDIALNVKLKVKGLVDSNGVVVAELVLFLAGGSRKSANEEE